MKVTMYQCDLCGKGIDESERCIVMISLTEKLNAGKGSAMNTTFDAHKSCLVKLNLPVPVGNVHLSEAPGNATGPTKV